MDQVARAHGEQMAAPAGPHWTGRADRISPAMIQDRGTKEGD